MSERKVLNKHIDPNFDHSKLVKVRKAMARQDNVRMMLPFSIKCDTCGNYLRIGTKINMRKEKVTNEAYLGISVYRFYMKCVFCYSEMTMKTDPKNHDYIMEIGAVRLYESWKDARAAEDLLKEIRKNEEEGNTMTFLEHKTYDSKREMDVLEAIDEIRVISKKNARIDIENLLDALHKRDSKLTDEELKEYVDRMSEIEQQRSVKKISENTQFDRVIQNISMAAAKRLKQEPQLLSKPLGVLDQSEQIALGKRWRMEGLPDAGDSVATLSSDVRNSTDTPLNPKPVFKDEADDNISSNHSSLKNVQADLAGIPKANPEAYKLVDFSDDDH